jgi:hypothetical protein
MIDVLYIHAEDSLREVKQGVEIYEGQPVSLDADGKLVPATATSKVYGIAKLDANQYKNVAWGEYAAYGTGRLSVILSGIVRVKASEFGKIEVTPAGPLSTTFVKKIFDDTKTYHVGDVLYVDNDGLITNTPVENGKVSIFGKVLKTPDANGWLEIEVVPQIATSGSDLA